MSYRSPVDELAQIRAEIQRLKAWADRIESSLIVNPALRFSGTWHLAELNETRRRMLDLSQLPNEIHKNPLYWREMIQRSITLVPHETAEKDDRGKRLLGRDGRVNPLH